MIKALMELTLEPVDARLFVFFCVCCSTKSDVAVWDPATQKYYRI